MSIPKDQQIVCPKCGKIYEVTIWESINTDLYANVPKNIISGSLFRATCPKCKYIANLEYDILYHDIKHRAMVWVVRPSDINYEKRVEEVRRTNLLGYSNTRIVSDMNELKEKVSALEAERDDRLVELAKVFFKYNLLKERPNFEFRNAFYSYADGKEIVFLYDQKGDYVHTYLEDDIYFLIEEMFASKVANLPDGDYQIFNFDDAEAMFLEVAEDTSDKIAIDDNNKELSKEQDKVKIKVFAKKRISPKNATSENKINFCHKCGNKLVEGSVFCSYCGTKVIKVI